MRKTGCSTVLSAKALGERPRDRGGAALDDEVEVRPLVGAIEQKVPDQPAHGGDRESERVAVRSRGAEDLPCPSRQPVKLAGDGEGEPGRRAAARGRRRPRVLGVPRPGGRAGPGPRRRRTATSDAVGGSSGDVPEDGRDRRPAEAEGEGAAERLPRSRRPTSPPMRAATSRARRRSARRAAGAHREVGRDDHEAPVHQPGRAGIDLRVARAADGHGGAPAHLARRRSRAAAGSHAHARGWNVR